MTHTNRVPSRLVFLTICLMFGAVGCGQVKKAKTQGNPDLAPDFGNSVDGQPFRLTDTGSDITYNANLLIWSPDATPELIRATSEASVNSRVTKAHDETFQRDVLAPLVEATKLAQDNLDKATAEVKIAEEKSSSLQRPGAESWFQSRVEELVSGNKISAADAVTATTNFNAYCEYKIWELATNPLLSHLLMKRPTPLAMCEPYYAQKGYLLASTSACADAPSIAGKDYFDCLWAEGLLKTQLYLPLATTVCGGTGPHAADTSVAVIRSWLGESHILRDALYDEAPFDENEPKSFGEKFRDDFVLKRGTLIGRFARHPELITCRKAFKYVPPVSGNVFDQQLNDLKTMVEGESVSAKPLLPLLDASGNVASADVERWEALARPLYFFAARSGTAVSVNDRLFNKAVGSTLETIAAYEEGFDSSPAFAGLRALAKAPAKVMEAKTQAQAKLFKLEKKSEKARQQKSELYKIVAAADEASINATSAPGVALAVIGLTIHVKRSNNMLKVTFDVGEDRIKIQDTVFFGNGQERDQIRDAGTIAPDRLTYNEETGALTLALSLDDPAKLGFAHLERREGEPTFNDLEADALRQNFLNLELYPDRLDGALDFVTGKASITSMGGPEYQGSISGAAYGTTDK